MRPSASASWLPRVILLGIVTAAAPTPAWTQTVVLPSGQVFVDTGGAQSLRGVAPVMIAVNAEIGSVDKDRLKGAAEQPLRRESVPLWSGDLAEWLKKPGLPVLIVQVTLMPMPELDRVSYSLEFELFQQTRLVRDPSLESYAITWRRGHSGVCRPSEVQKQLEGASTAIANLFALGYHLANTPP